MIVAKKIATFRTDAAVLSLEFSPDSYLLAFATTGKVISLCQSPFMTEEEVISFYGHSDFVQSVTFNPKHRFLASASDDKTVRVWDIGKEREVNTFRHPCEVTSVAFSPSGKILASSGCNGTIYIWDFIYSGYGRRITSGELKTTLTGHSSYIRSIAFSPDGKILASASGCSDACIKLWDVSTEQELYTIRGDLYDYRSVAFSPDSKFIVFVGRDKLKIVSLSSLQEVAALVGHTDDINSVTFSPCSQIIASGCEDGTVKLWDVNALKEIATLDGHSLAVNSVAFTYDGKFLASGSTDKTIILWELKQEKEKMTENKNDIDRLNTKFPNLNLSEKENGDISATLDNIRISIYQQGSDYAGSINVYDDSRSFLPVCNLKHFEGDREKVFLWLERWLKSMSFRLYSNYYQKIDSLNELQKRFPTLAWGKRNDFEYNTEVKVPDSEAFLQIIFRRQELVYEASVTLYNKKDDDQYVQLIFLSGGEIEVLDNLERFFEEISLMFTYLANN
jgi:WD40 repeat protein